MTHTTRTNFIILAPVISS